MQKKKHTQETPGFLQVGDQAPDFCLPSQSGTQVCLSDFRGKAHVVLFFYPKDESPGCTKEACTFRDSYEAFQDAETEVIGVSTDSVASHEQFAKKNRLPYTLLSDGEGQVRKLYGVPATFGLIPGRVTYVIDKQGRVRSIFSSQFAPEKHIAEALKTIKANSHQQNT